MSLPRPLRPIKRLLGPFYLPIREFVLNQWRRRNARYECYRRKLKIKECTILYESYWGRGMLCNPYALFLELLHNPQFKEYEHVWVLDNLEMHQDLIYKYAVYPNVKFVQFLKQDYLKALAQAKYLITNTTFYTFFHKREEQVFINTWHGIPLKKLGFDIPDGKIESYNTVRNFLQADYLISTDPFLTEIYMRAYKLDGLYTNKIIQEGYPRLDLLVRHSQEEYIDVLRSLGVSVATDKKIILYAPTWREPENDSLHIKDILKKYQQVKEQIEAIVPQYQVLVKVHQFVYEQIKGSAYPNYIIPATIDANEVLPIADILLGDYSSIYFDYLYFERPILFYIPDLDDYANYRGLYNPIEALPGPASKKLEEIIRWLTEIDKIAVEYRPKLIEAKCQFCGKNVGQIAKKIVDIVFFDHVDGYKIFNLASNKKKVLLQTGRLSNSKKGQKLFEVLSQIDTDRCDVTVMAPAPVSAKQKELFEQFDNKVRVLARKGGTNFSLWESIRNGLASSHKSKSWGKWVLPLEAYRRETHRRFCGMEFDYTINTGEYDFSNVIIAAILNGSESLKEIPLDRYEENNLQKIL